MVVISCPWASTARVRQAYRAIPSKSTVQAPHSPRSHPGLVPVSPSFSRSTNSRVQRGSTRSLWDRPFTVRAIGCIAAGSSTAASAGPWARMVPEAATAATPVPMLIMNPRRVIPWPGLRPFWSGSSRFMVALLWLKSSGWWGSRSRSRAGILWRRWAAAATRGCASLGFRDTPPASPLSNRFWERRSRGARVSSLRHFPVHMDLILIKD